MIDIKALGQAIRQHREAKCISVAQLADKVGVTTRYMYQIEAWEREPRTELVIWIIAALDMEMEDILELTNEKADG